MSYAQVYALAEALLLTGAGLSLVVLASFLFVSAGSWRHSLTGAAILVSTVALVLLLNVEIVLSLVGASDYTDAVVTAAVIAAINAGLVFKGVAIWVEWRRSRRAE